VSWASVGKKALELGLPLLGGVLGGPAGAGVGRLVASAVTGDPEAEPDEVERALVAADPQVIVRLREIEADNRVELEKLALEGERHRLAHESAHVAESARTQRAEIASEDWYVRRARPTWVYVGAFGVGAVVLALCGSITVATAMLFAAAGEPETIAGVTAGVQALLEGGAQLAGALMPIIAFVAGVAGYYVKRRSDDKQLAAGAAAPRGLIDAIGERLTGAG